MRVQSWCGVGLQDDDLTLAVEQSFRRILAAEEQSGDSSEAKVLIRPGSGDWCLRVQDPNQENAVVMWIGPSIH